MSKAAEERDELEPSLVVGSLFTLLWFVLAVSIITGLFFIGYGAVLIAFFYAFFISSIVGFFGMMLIGAPLALFAKHLSRGARSPAVRSLAMFAAGLLTGAIVSVILAALGLGWDYYTLYLGILTLITGLASLAGWHSALHAARKKTRRPRYDPFTATDLP